MLIERVENRDAPRLGDPCPQIDPSLDKPGLHRENEQLPSRSDGSRQESGHCPGSILAIDPQDPVGDRGALDETMAASCGETFDWQRPVYVLRGPDL